jgi:hypothetical protein
MKLEVGMYVRTDKGFISQIKEFKEHYTKGKRLVTSSKVKEVDENYLSLSGNQCDFIDSIDYSIPPCYPSDEEIEKIKRHIVKASYNIIDILEEGDIIIDSVEKHEILLIDGELMVRNTGLIYDNNYYLPIKSITIKSVITHEQMEQINYKLGE